MIGIIRVIYFKNKLLIAAVFEGESRRSRSFEQCCKGAAWLHLEVTAQMTDTASLGKQLEAKMNAEQEAAPLPCVEYLSIQGRSSACYCFSLYSKIMIIEDAVVSVLLYLWGGRNF